MRTLVRRAVVPVMIVAGAAHGERLLNASARQPGAHRVDHGL